MGLKDILGIGDNPNPQDNPQDVNIQDQNPENKPEDRLGELDKKIEDLLKKQEELENMVFSLSKTLEKTKTSSDSDYNADDFNKEYTFEELEEIKINHPEYRQWAIQKQKELLEKSIEEKIGSQLKTKLSVMSEIEKLTSQYPDLLDKNSQLSKEVANTLAQLPPNTWTEPNILKLVIENTANKIGYKPSLRYPALGMVGNTPTHNNIEEPLELTSQQEAIARAFGLSKEQYLNSLKETKRIIQSSKGER